MYLRARGHPFNLFRYQKFISQLVIVYGLERRISIATKYALGLLLLPTNICARFSRLETLNCDRTETLTQCADWSQFIIDFFLERQDFIEVFKMSQGKPIIGLQDLFILGKNNKGTRGHSLKSTKVRPTRDCWKHFFSNRLANR